MVAKAPAAPVAVPFRLRAKYDDGTYQYMVGDIVNFVPGKQPRTAVLVVSAPVGTGEAEAEDEK